MAKRVERSSRVGNSLLRETSGAKGVSRVETTGYLTGERPVHVWMYLVAPVVPGQSTEARPARWTTEGCPLRASPPARVGSSAAGANPRGPGPPSPAQPDHAGQAVLAYEY